MVIIITSIFIDDINHSLLFRPKKITNSEFLLFCNKHKNNVKDVSFYDETNKKKISAIFISNSNDKQNDKVVFYCHGNSWCISDLYYSSPIRMLMSLNNISIFMFDYSGYGNTVGPVTLESIKSDTLSAWNYLLDGLKININNVILYGRSLGGYISLQLLSNLLDNKKDIPKSLIIDSSFKSIKSTVNKLFFGLGFLVSKKYNLDNLQLLKKICKHNQFKINIIIVHSKDDDLISDSEATELSVKTNNKYIEISGSHSNPKYNETFVNIMNNL